MNKVVLLIFLCSFFNGFSASFVKGKLIYKDGREKEGRVKLLSTCLDKKIKYKQDEGAKQEIIPSNELAVLIYYIGEEVHVLEYLGRDVTGYKKGLDRPRWTSPAWKYVLITGPVTMYLTGISKMKVKNDKLILQVPEIVYYDVKRPTESGSMVVGMGGLRNEWLIRKYATIYFSDYPELVARIEDKNSGLDTVRETVNIYNDWANKKDKKK